MTRDPGHCSFVALPCHVSHPTTKSGCHPGPGLDHFHFWLKEQISLHGRLHFPSSWDPGLERSPTSLCQAAGWTAGVDACGPGG